MKQPTHSQQWYDRLCRIYNIGDFPPLHSFSFTDWHWINDDDFEKDRSFKIIPSTSLSNDYWTMIMDDKEIEQSLGSRILYSDAVRRSAASSSSSSSPASITEWRNSHSAHLRKDRRHTNTSPTADNEDDEQDDLWFQYKNTRLCHQQQQRRRVFTGERRLKPKTALSTRSCFDGDKKKNHVQRKTHVRKLTHQGKSPIRLVRHQNRHNARYYNH